MPPRWMLAVPCAALRAAPGCGGQEDAVSPLRQSPFGIVACIDHAANAEATGDSLRPMHVTLFGNPALGTPLMQDAPTLAIDLPQKMLVYEDDDGAVRIAYSDPSFLAERAAGG